MWFESGFEPLQNQINQVVRESETRLVKLRSAAKTARVFVADKFRRRSLALGICPDRRLLAPTVHPDGQLLLRTLSRSRNMELFPRVWGHPEHVKKFLPEQALNDGRFHSRRFCASTLFWRSEIQGHPRLTGRRGKISEQSAKAARFPSASWFEEFFRGRA